MQSIDNHGRARFRTKLGIYLLFLAVYLTGASGHFYSTDHVSVYLTTQSIVEDGDLSIKPILNTVKGRNGESFSYYGIGQSLVSAPLYAVGRAVDDAGSPRTRQYFAGDNIGNASAVQWGGTVPIFFVSLLNQLIAPLICVLVFMFLLELGFSAGTSLLTTLIFGFGTGVFVAAHEFFQHSLETLLLLAAIYVLVAHREHLRPRHAGMAGALLGFGLLTRINLIIAAPPIGLYLIAMTRNAPTPGADTTQPQNTGSSVAGPLSWPGLTPTDARVLRNLCAFLAPLAGTVGIILWINYLKYGGALNFGSAEAPQFSAGNLVIGLYGFLLSPGRSIFLYSPPLVLGLFGARRFYAVRRAEALLFGTIACTYLLFYSSQNIWHGGWSWGPRYLLPAVPLLVISSAYVLENRRAVVAAIALGVAGFAVQILGTVENVSFVTVAHWGNVSTGREPFLFVPQISPVPTHVKDLLQNRNVDLWLVYVWEHFGTRVLLLTLAVPMSIFSAAVLLLRDVVRRPHIQSKPRHSI